MARVTIEDCLKNIDDRFKIVLVASKRAKEIKLGASTPLDTENDKATVLALREIAAGIEETNTFSQILDEDDPDLEPSMPQE
tara:strand:- start:1215 stop:1460 length:246 start_codon:yes stop_codon:yes gene_type:complete